MAIESTREHSAKTEVVPLYHGGKIEVTPDDKEEQVIATEKLNGCVAAVVACETAAGIRTVQLTHFPDFMQGRQERAAAKLTTVAMQTAEKKKVLLFVQRKRAGSAGALKLFFRNLLGADAKVEIKLYDSDPKQDDSGSISISVPPSGKGEIEYQTWYESGEVFDTTD